MQPIRLSRRSLGRLASHIEVPGYPPQLLVPSIVHLGFGGFHRAHMARYTHNLLQSGINQGAWGIVGVGLRPADLKIHEALVQQEGLYTLVERNGTTESVAVIGIATEHLYAAESSARLLQAIDQQAIKIVSLTITENGYCLNAASKQLDPDHPAIAADLLNPQRPHSAIGIVTEAFRRRMAAGAPAFTALSCDNIQHNGGVLKRAVLDFAALRDPALASWIDVHARFPNTMVDRITPVTRPEDIAQLAQRHGLIDDSPVFSETFTQWVIEDDFTDGRPDWQRVGAQFVVDVEPYEFMKLRLLNTSHLAVAGLGRLAGYRFIDEAIANPRIRAFTRALMDRETEPTLMPVPGVDLQHYKSTLLERFANPAIEDTVDRVNADAPLNILLDPIRDRLKMHASIELLALALAAWMRRVSGVDESGKPMNIVHPLAALLREKALDGGIDARPLLGIQPLFGELGQDEVLIATLGKWLKSLYTVGAAETLVRAQEELRY
jgi:mannitol 2-dehydrogenase